MHKHHLFAALAALLLLAGMSEIPPTADGLAPQAVEVSAQNTGEAHRAARTADA